MRTLLAIPLVLLAAGCLSKPDRPSGIDAAVLPVDAPIPPRFTYRRDVEVGDIDGDNFDDLVRWGNITEGTQPRVWVFKGSSVGLHVFPDIELDTTLSTTAAWYEVLDVSVDDYDPTRPHPELIVLSAEDGQVPNGNDPVARDLHVDVFNPITDGTAPFGRSGTIAHDALGGLARFPTPAFVLERTSAGIGAEIIFGGLDVAARVSDLTPPFFGLPEQVDMQDQSGIGLPFVQDCFDTPGIPDENMLAADQGVAWSSDGDAGGASPAYQGLTTPFQEGARKRAAREATGTDPLVIAAEGEGSSVLQIIRDNPGAAPGVFQLALLAEEPTDFALGNVGGTDELDAVVLDDNTLYAYVDLNLGGGTAMPTRTITGANDFVGYNVIAIGNFSDAGSGAEIYVLGNDVPPRCVVLNGGMLEGC